VPPPTVELPREPRLCPPSRTPPASGIPAVLMYRPPRWSTADRAAGMWNPPSATVPFGQDVQGRFDLFEHKEEDVEEAHTGNSITE